MDSIGHWWTPLVIGEFQWWTPLVIGELHWSLVDSSGGLHWSLVDSSGGLHWWSKGEISADFSCYSFLAKAMI